MSGNVSRVVCALGGNGTLWRFRGTLKIAVRFVFRLTLTTIIVSVRRPQRPGPASPPTRREVRRPRPPRPRPGAAGEGEEVEPAEILPVGGLHRRLRLPVTLGSYGRVDGPGPAL